MEEKESTTNTNDPNCKNDNSKESKKNTSLNTKKLQASLFAFSESMPNLLSFSPRTSGVSNEGHSKAVLSPKITEGM